MNKSGLTISRYYTVAVAAFSLSGHAKQNQDQEYLFASCFQIAIDTYDAVLAASGNMRLASIAADAAYDSCQNQQ